MMLEVLLHVVVGKLDRNESIGKYVSEVLPHNKGRKYSSKQTNFIVSVINQFGDAWSNCPLAPADSFKSACCLSSPETVVPFRLTAAKCHAAETSPRHLKKCQLTI